jgi:hypothetical protein
LLEHGGADFGDILSDGDTIWDLLEEYLIEGGVIPEDDADDYYKADIYDATAVTSLLRVMVLRGAPRISGRTNSPSVVGACAGCRGWCATAGVPGAAAGPPGRALSADFAAPGAGARLRGAHDN